MSKHRVTKLRDFLNERNGFLGVANHFCRPILTSAPQRSTGMSGSSASSAGGSGSKFFKHHFLVKATKVSLFSNLNFEQTCLKTTSSALIMFRFKHSNFNKVYNCFSIIQINLLGE